MLDIAAREAYWTKAQHPDWFSSLVGRKLSLRTSFGGAVLDISTMLRNQSTLRTWGGLSSPRWRHRTVTFLRIASPPGSKTAAPRTSCG